MTDVRCFLEVGMMFRICSSFTGTSHDDDDDDDYKCTVDICLCIVASTHDFAYQTPCHQGR